MAVDYSLSKPTAGTSRTTAVAEVGLMGDLSDTVADIGARLDGLTPVKVSKSDGNLVISATSGAWAEVDSSGSAAARSLDVVIPNVSAGQWIKVRIDGAWASEAVDSARLDFYTIVSGVKTNSLSGDTESGISSTRSISGQSRIGAEVSYQAVSGDIEGGSVRCRLYARSGGTKTIWANAAFGYRLDMEGTGPFQ